MKNALTATQIKKMKAGERLSDGAGLRVGRNASGSLFFTYRYTFNGKQQTIGCGGADTTLAQARDKRVEFEKLIRAGKNPKAQKAIVELQAKAQVQITGDGPTFRLVFEQFWEDVQQHNLSNDKDRLNWRNSVYTYFEPILDMPVEMITSAMVADLLRPHWRDKHDMMDKTLRKGAQAYRYALAKELASKANPFDKSVVSILLPEVTAAERHHESIDFTHAPGSIRTPFRLWPPTVCPPPRCRPHR